MSWQHASDDVIIWILAFVLPSTPRNKKIVWWKWAMSHGLGSLSDFFFPCTFLEPWGVAMCLFMFHSEVRSGDKSVCVCLSPWVCLLQKYVKITFLWGYFKFCFDCCCYTVFSGYTAPELVKAVAPFLLFITFVFHIFFLSWDMYLLIHIYNIWNDCYEFISSCFILDLYHLADP